MQSIVTPLTDEEKEFLFHQRNSEHFRVYQKAINYLYATQAVLLVRVERQDLEKTQGILHGLAIAANILSQQKIPEEMLQRPKHQARPVLRKKS